jgi:hypothetical protein
MKIAKKLTLALSKGKKGGKSHPGETAEGGISTCEGLSSTGNDPSLGPV